MVDLYLADFNPAAVAMTPLLVAAYAAERRQWTRFYIASFLTVLSSSELGLVVAMAMGIALILEKERRAGIRAAVGGLVWTCVAVSSSIKPSSAPAWSSRSAPSPSTATAASRSSSRCCGTRSAPWASC